MVLSRRQWLIHLCVCTWAWLAWGLVMPEALALGGPQPPIGEMAPTFTLPTNSGAGDRKSTRLNSSHVRTSRMPSSA